MRILQAFRRRRTEASQANLIRPSEKSAAFDSCDGAHASARATVTGMGSTTPRRGIVRSLAKLAVAVVLVLGVASLPSSAAEDPTYPGLPAFEEGGAWVGPQASGINEVAKAKQWIRLPPLFLQAWNRPNRAVKDPSCRRIKPYVNTTDFHATVFFNSNPVITGAPEPYGYVGPYVVRTMAFGSVPVEAEVLFAQPRDHENLPVGYELRQTTHEFCAGLGPNAGPGEMETSWDPVDFSAPVNISITDLKVDDVDLDLMPGCQPSEPSVMKLASLAYFSLDPSVTPDEEPTQENLFTTPFFGMANGGLLTGTIDIADFSGCRTSAGEDVSPLLSAAVSGPSNAVRVRSQGLQNFSKGCGQPDGVSPCPAPLPGLAYPAGDAP